MFIHRISLHRCRGVRATRCWHSVFLWTLVYSRRYCASFLPFLRVPVARLAICGRELYTVSQEKKQDSRLIRNADIAGRGFSFTAVLSRELPAANSPCEMVRPCKKKSDIAATISLPNVSDIIAKRRLALFGHVVRLDANTPVHQILRQAVDVKSGHRPDAQWRRPPGRPRNSWIQRINNASLTGIRQSWRAAEDRTGHRGSSLQASAAALLMRHDDDDEIFQHNFGKCWPVIKIVSLCDSQIFSPQYLKFLRLALNVF